MSAENDLNKLASFDLTKNVNALLSSIASFSELDEEEDDQPCEDCQNGDCQLIAHSFSDTDERRER